MFNAVHIYAKVIVQIKVAPLFMDITATFHTFVQRELSVSVV